MTKKKGEFTVLRNIRAGMVIILLIYIGLIFQSKGDSDTPFADVQKAVVDAADDKNMTLAGTQEIKRFYGRAGLYLPDADFHSVQLFLRNGHCIKSRKKIAGAQSDLYDRCKPVYSWIFQILRIYRNKFKCDPSVLYSI